MNYSTLFLILSWIQVCEDCETSLASIYCTDCQNATDGVGVSLCKGCSDLLHTGATRRRHNLIGRSCINSACIASQPQYFTVI